MAGQRAEIQVFSQRSSQRTGNRGGAYDRTQVWTEGNTVRRELPVHREEQRPERIIKREKENASIPRMNLGYVAFLTMTAVIMVGVCAFYLKLQYRCTTLQKSVTSLQSSLASMKLDNDEDYNRIMAGVNLEKVKEDAMSRLGMVYAYEDQIVIYEAAKEDFVKQYQQIPE